MRGGRWERLTMTRLTGISLCSLLFLASDGASLRVAAQEADTTFPKMVGEWTVPGAITTITIRDNRIVLHSRLGKGDLTHVNADYYNINYRERSMICHYVVRIDSAIKIELLRQENTDPSECDLSELLRAPYVEGILGGVVELWAQIKDSEDPKVFEAFRHQFGAKYPNYDTRAKKRIVELTQASADKDTSDDKQRPLEKTDAARPSEGVDLAKTIQQSPSAGKGLTLESEAQIYRTGDVANFTVVAPQGCFLTLVDQDDRGRDATVIFPNKFQQMNFIRGNTAVTLPGADAPFQFRLKEPGTETVTAICTDKDIPVDGIIHDFNRSSFTAVPDYPKAVKRAIVVESKRVDNFQPAQANIWRAVVKVLVR